MIDTQLSPFGGWDWLLNFNSSNMKLSVTERLTLLQILPPMNNFVTMNIVLELSKNVGLSENEVKELGIKKGENKIEWDVTKEKEKEIEFSEVEKGIIKDALRKLDEEKKVELVHISLWNKFM